MKTVLAIGAVLSLALCAFLWGRMFHHHHSVTISANFPGPEDKEYFALCAQFTFPGGAATEIPPPDGIERIARPGDVYELCYRRLRWPLTDRHGYSYVGRTLKQDSKTLRFPGPPLWPLVVLFGLLSAVPFVAACGAAAVLRFASRSRS